MIDYLVLRSFLPRQSAAADRMAARRRSVPRPSVELIDRRKLQCGLTAPLSQSEAGDRVSGVGRLGPAAHAHPCPSSLRSCEPLGRIGPGPWKLRVTFVRLRRSDRFLHVDVTRHGDAQTFYTNRYGPSIAAGYVTKVAFWGASAQEGRGFRFPGIQALALP
jgi:hypothetical protein